jgi:hypothetical protein
MGTVWNTFREMGKKPPGRLIIRVYEGNIKMELNKMDCEDWMLMEWSQDCVQW